MTPVGIQTLLFMDRGLELSPHAVLDNDDSFTLWASVAVTSTLVHRLIGLFGMFPNEAKEAKEGHRCTGDHYVDTSRRRDTTWARTQKLDPEKGFVLRPCFSVGGGFFGELMQTFLKVWTHLQNGLSYFWLMDNGPFGEYEHLRWKP